MLRSGLPFFSKVTKQQRYKQKNKTLAGQHTLQPQVKVRLISLKYVASPSTYIIKHMS